MHEAAPARPRLVSFGQHRHELHAASLVPFLHECRQIEVFGAARAPIQMQWPFESALDGVFDDRLHRRESRACGKQYGWLLRPFAQGELSERQLDAQPVALRDAAQHTFGEPAAGHVAHVQLHAVVFVRRIRHRIVAPRAVRQLDLQILAGAELGAHARRQPQLQNADVGGRLRDAVHGGVERLSRDGVALLDATRRNRQIRVGAQAAQQRTLGRPRYCALHRRTRLSRHETSFAGRADALAARVRHRVSGAFGRVEHGFTGRARERYVAVSDGNTKIHRYDLDALSAS